jgi:hypothetical protein
MRVLPATANRQGDSQRHSTPTEGTIMVIKTRSQLKGKVRDDYLGLVLKFPPASIKSEEQFQDAQAVIDDLLAKGKLGAGEKIYLDALSDLVAAYEDARYPIAPASDADMLGHLMEAKGLAVPESHLRRAGHRRRGHLLLVPGKAG